MTRISIVNASNSVSRNNNQTGKDPDIKQQFSEEARLFLKGIEAMMGEPPVSVTAEETQILKRALRIWYSSEMQEALSGIEVNDDMTPVHLAVILYRFHWIPFIKDIGGDLNARMQNGHAALHTASFHGEKEAIKTLAENGADMNVPDEMQGTALHVVATITPTQYEEMKDFLISMGVRDKPNVIGRTADAIYKRNIRNAGPVRGVRLAPPMPFEEPCIEKRPLPDEVYIKALKVMRGEDMNFEPHPGGGVLNQGQASRLLLEGE